MPRRKPTNKERRRASARRAGLRLLRQEVRRLLAGGTTAAELFEGLRLCVVESVMAE